MTDPEYTRLSRNVSEMALEVHASWMAHASCEDKAAAMDTIKLWEERFNTAVLALWEYREKAKQVATQ